MKGIIKSKKGGLSDLVFIIGTLTIVGFMVLLGFKFIDEFNTRVTDLNLLNERGTNAVNDIRNLYPTVIDNSFLYLTIGLMIVALILAMLVAIHPVFFVFYFILLMITIFLGGVFSNIYQEAALNTELVGVADQLMWTSHILTWLPIIVGVFGFILAIVLYRTFQGSQ